MAGHSRVDERGYNQIFHSIGTTPLRTQRRSDWFVQNIKPGSRVLEIGCGVGDMAAYIAAHSEAELVAVDLSELFIAEARQTHVLPNLRFEQFNLLAEDVTRLGQFDVVIGNGILHHLVLKLEVVLSTLRAMTTQGGQLAFIEPNFLNPYCAFTFGTRLGRRLGRLEPDEMAFTPWELRRVLTAAGWKNAEVKTRDFLVPNLPLWTIRPILAVEPLAETFPLTRWLAQSHFITAQKL